MSEWSSGFPTFFNLSPNFAIRSSWSEPQSAPSLVFADCIGLLHLCCKEYYQSDFGIDYLVMSMCGLFSCDIWRGWLLWPVCSLGKTLLAFALLRFVLQDQICLFSRYLLTSYFCISVLYNEKNIFFGVFVLEGLVGVHGTVQLQLLQH